MTKQPLQNKKPFQTKIPCKVCGATYDCSQLKEAIKKEILEKFNADLDWILEEL